MPHRGRGWPLGAAAAALAATPVVLAAFVEGPLPGMTGGFGEPTCRQCHFDNPLNDPAGSVSISGVPTHYTPGLQYPIAVTLRRPGLARGGFELAVRYTDPARAGRQAGSLAPVDARVQMVDAIEGDVRYAQHTRDGSVAAESGDIRWVVRWLAPPGGAVIFHLAANASNDDASPLGDFIYTATMASAPAGDGRPE